MFHNIAQEFREIIRLVIGEAGGKMLQELLRSGGAEGAKIVAERVHTLITKNPRTDLLFALIGMEPGQWDKIKALHKRKLAEGTENLFVLALGEALPRTADGKVDTEAAQRILGQLNALTETDLEQMVEFLSHDPIAQWFRYYVLGKGRGAVVAMGESVAELAGRALGELDRLAAGDLPQLQERIAAAREGLRARLEARRSGRSAVPDPYGLRDFERRFMGRRRP